MYWWVLDLIIIVIMLGCFFAYYRKGLLSALVGIIGVIAAFMLAFWVGGKLAGPIYDNLVRDKLVQAASEKIEQGSEDVLSQLTGKDVDLGEVFGGEQGDSTESAAEKLVDSTVGSGARNAVRTGVTILTFFVALIIINWIESLLRTANGIPLIGPLNRLFGGVLGLAAGAFWSYLFVSLCALVIRVSLDSLSWLNSSMVDSTVVFSLIYPYNLLNYIAGAAV